MAKTIGGNEIALLMHGRGKRHGSRKRRYGGTGGGGHLGGHPGGVVVVVVDADDPWAGIGAGGGDVLVLETELCDRLPVGVGLQQLCLRRRLFQVRPWRKWRLSVRIFLSESLERENKGL